MLRGWLHAQEKAAHHAANIDPKAHQLNVREINSIINDKGTVADSHTYLVSNPQAPPTSGPLNVARIIGMKQYQKKNLCKAVKLVP